MVTSTQFFRYLNLIDFDNTVDFSNEPEACKESD